MITLLYGTRPPIEVAAAPEGDALWLSADVLTAATGWSAKAEGLCQGNECIRAPQGVPLVRDDTRVNLTVLAALLGQPVVRDKTHGVWSFGEATAARRTTPSSLQAPDFTLPDLDGRLHSLRDYRGSKVFLVSWASW